MGTMRICPSILNADHSQLFSEIDRVSSADLLHLDIMDNIFVPNITFDFETSKRIIAHSQIPVDSHLMIHNPDEAAVNYAHAGSASVTFHCEASQNPLHTIRTIKAAGARAGLAIKPATPFSAVKELLSELDMLLIMTVEPGFGGQKFMADQMPKLHEAALAIAEMSENRPWLQVDGGITLETIVIAAQSGADTFVAGSAIYKSDNPAEMISSLRTTAQSSRS
jgi:ribulose-phosphate 3-epimerase